MRPTPEAVDASSQAGELEPARSKPSDIEPSRPRPVKPIPVPDAVPAAAFFNVNCPLLARRNDAGLRRRIGLTASVL